MVYTLSFLKKPQNLIFFLIGIVLLLAFIGFEVGISMSGNQMWAIILFILVMGVLFYFLLQKGKHSTVMEAAKKFAVDYWYRETKEELSRDEEQGFEGYFDRETPLFGFSFKKISGSRPVVIIVKKTAAGFDIAKYKEKPTSEEVADPFRIFEGVMFRSPVPTDLMPKYFANQLPYRNPQVSVSVGQEKKEDEFKKMGGG